MRLHPAGKRGGLGIPGPVFIGKAFTGLLEGCGIKVSMDGKGSYSDNLFIERLWSTKRSTSERIGAAGR
jgi:transposase InsO family protein